MNRFWVPYPCRNLAHLNPANVSSNISCRVFSPSLCKRNGPRQQPFLIAEDREQMPGRSQISLGLSLGSQASRLNHHPKGRLSWRAGRPGQSGFNSKPSPSPRPIGRHQASKPPHRSRSDDLRSPPSRRAPLPLLRFYHGPGGAFLRQFRSAFLPRKRPCFEVASRESVRVYFLSDISPM